MKNTILSLSNKYGTIIDQEYVKLDVPLDRLPYSEQFWLFYNRFIKAADPMDFPIVPEVFWNMVIHRRKSGKLPTLRKIQKSLFTKM